MSTRGGGRVLGKGAFLFRQTGDQTRLFINWADVKGIGLVSGDRYVLQDNFQGVVTITAAGGTEESIEHFRMIRQGSPDNLQAFVHVIFDLATGTVDIVDLRVECRG